MANNKRYHPPDRIADHPMIKQAFQIMGAVLIATKAKDLEADFIMAGETGNAHRFHVEISEVQP